MKQVAEIVQKIGRTDITRGLGVTTQAVSIAISDNRFPASWYETISKLAAGKQIEVPFDLFNMRRSPKEAAE